MSDKRISNLPHKPIPNFGDSIPILDSEETIDALKNKVVYLKDIKFDGVQTNNFSDTNFPLLRNIHYLASNTADITYTLAIGSLPDSIGYSCKIEQRGTGKLTIQAETAPTYETTIYTNGNLTTSGIGTGFIITKTGATDFSIVKFGASVSDATNGLNTGASGVGLGGTLTSDTIINGDVNGTKSLTLGSNSGIGDPLVGGRLNNFFIRLKNAFRMIIADPLGVKATAIMDFTSEVFNVTNEPGSSGEHYTLNIVNDGLIFYRQDNEGSSTTFSARKEGFQLIAYNANPLLYIEKSIVFNTITPDSGFQIFDDEANGLMYQGDYTEKQLLNQRAITDVGGIRQMLTRGFQDYWNTGNQISVVANISRFLHNNIAGAKTNYTTYSNYGQLWDETTHEITTNLIPLGSILKATLNLDIAPLVANQRFIVTALIPSSEIQSKVILAEVGFTSTVNFAIPITGAISGAGITFTIFSPSNSFTVKVRNMTFLVDTFN